MLNSSKNVKNEKCTKFILHLLILLIVIQIFIGIFIFVYGEYARNLIGNYVTEIEKNEFDIKLLIMELYGLHIIVYYICGIPLSCKCANDNYTKHLRLLLRLWNVFIFIASIDGFLIAYIFSHSEVYILHSVKLALFKGIENYHSNPDWRLIWDDLQYHEQCCGVFNYTDWQIKQWMQYEIDDDNNRLKDVHLLTLTPYSCCKKTINCYHMYIPQHLKRTWIELPSLDMKAINLNGCFNYFIKRIKNIIHTFIIITIIVFINQLLILILMQTIYIRNRYLRYPKFKDQESQCLCLQNDSLTTTTSTTTDNSKNYLQTNSMDSLVVLFENDLEDPSTIELQKKDLKNFQYNRRNSSNVRRLSNYSARGNSKISKKSLQRSFHMANMDNKSNLSNINELSALLEH